VSETPTADLLKYASARGVDLTERGAILMRQRIGDAGARDRVDAIGALIDLASAWGRKLTTLAAIRRLDHADGDFEAARDRLIDPLLRRRQRAFDAGWRRAECDLRARDARSRHAAFLAELCDAGSLGHRATLMLMAAADAGLRNPHAAARRARLWRLVDVELSRRHPSRPKLDEPPPDDPAERIAWEAERAREAEHLAPTLEAERAARELLTRQLLDDDGEPSLAITVDRLADHPGFRGDVERELRAVRGQLADALACDDAGAWSPDPARYHRDVIGGAAEAAREAA
jgi:hypothetical protein